jgi:DnaJ-class molecular chaperone
VTDPYQVLGIARGASAAEIKAAYRRRARELHPDSDPGNPLTEDRFKELGNAYALLSDAAQRARFDAGEIDAAGNPRPRATAGRDPFEAFWKRRRRRAVRSDGANVTYSLKVGFIEAARGTTKRIGMANGKHLEVTVPAGTRDGQVLRLRGQGMPGIGGGAAGDALVEIRVPEDDRFDLRGCDVHTEHAITLPEAVLGGRIAVETVGGTLTVTVPPGSNTGTRLRLKGKGMAAGGRHGGEASGGNGSGGPRGDHYVTLKIVLPPKPDADLTAFVERWARKKPYKPGADD